MYLEMADCEVEYNCLCRLCATKISTILGLHIFESEGLARQIESKVKTLLPVQINVSDNLPKMICQDCLFKLDVFYEFREKSVLTEQILLTLFRELPTLKGTSDSTISVSNTPIANDSNPESLIISQLSKVRCVSESEQKVIKEHNLHHSEVIDQLTASKININNTYKAVNVLRIKENNTNSLHLPSNEIGRRVREQEQEIIEEQVLLQNEAIEQLVRNKPKYDSSYKADNIPTADQDKREFIFITQSNVELCAGNQVVENALTNKNEEMDQNIEIVTAQTVEISSDPIQTEGPITKRPQRSVAEKYQQIVEKYVKLENKERNGSRNRINAETPETDNIVQNGLNLNDYESQPYSDVASSGIFLDPDHVTESELQEMFNSIEPQSSVSTDGIHSVYFFCDFCTVVIAYRDKNEFIEHYRAHWLKCEHCLALFKDEMTMLEHQKKDHNLQKDISDKSDSKLMSEIKVEDNELDEESHSEGEVKFNEVEAIQKDSDDMQTKTKGKGWQPKVCNECGKQFRSNYKLNEHMRKHTGEQPFKCTACNKGFRSKIGLAQHEATHTGIYEYSCPTCGKGFQCRSYLAVHQRVHSDAKPYNCVTCNRYFKTKQALLDHMNRHLGVKPYMCDICGRSFITKGLCKSHQKVHSGTDNRQYPCTVCNKMFVSKSYLSTHLRIHTGEKPFGCEVCGKGFLTRVDLRIHSTMHTGEKSFVCEMCGKAFARRDALRCHHRSHTGERPYRCDICGQSFTQFSPMTIHKRLHTGERPYECDICLKPFVSRSTMVAHRRKHPKN